MRHLWHAARIDEARDLDRRDPRCGQAPHELGARLDVEDSGSFCRPSRGPTSYRVTRRALMAAATLLALERGRLAGMSKPIVVGVDGSDASRAALRWAAEEAGLRSVPLVLVHAWSFIPPQPIGDPGLLAVPVGDLPGQLDAERDAAAGALEGAVSEALAVAPGIEVEEKLVEGDAGDALVAESESAEFARRRLARALRASRRRSSGRSAGTWPATRRARWSS